MPNRRSTILLAAALLAPGLLAACAAAAPEPGRVTGSFDATGITRVVLRAAMADDAVVDVTAVAGKVTVSGQAAGGAEGYHPADPRWRETPAAEWGLGFAAKRFGPTLVISTRNEISFIHHHYAITGIRLRVPPSVELSRQRRVLNGSGEADLAPP